MLLRCCALLVCVLLCATPVMAHTTVIAELGTAPLLGTSTSTADLRARVAANDHVLWQAARKLGLSDAEYQQVRSAIGASHVAWVVVPRHLDGMTWRSGSAVYALHDVVIPAQTHGWEIDVAEPHAVAAVYMPAACGNLSLVRRAVPVVAHRPAPPVVAAALPPAPVEAAAPQDVVADAPVVADATEFPPAPVAAAAHHFTLAPLLFGLAGIVGALASGGPAAAPIDACP